jgi:uncharacterized protein YbdZ (MbtH family)
MGEDNNYSLLSLGANLRAGFRKSQQTKKKEAVSNWVRSRVDKLPSEKIAMLRSMMPSTQKETPSSQIRCLKSP